MFGNFLCFLWPLYQLVFVLELKNLLPQHMDKQGHLISVHEYLECQVVKSSENKDYFLRLFQLFFVIYNYCKEK